MKPNLDELPELTPAERAAMESINMTAVLGTWEERYHVAMNGARRLMRERDTLRSHIRALVERFDRDTVLDDPGCLTLDAFHRWIDDAKKLIQ